MRKIWILGLMLVFLVPLLAVADVSAAKPSTGSGTVAMTSRTVLDHDVVSDHTTIDTVKVTFSVTGVLSGTAVAIERDISHNITTSKGTITTTTFHGRGNFTGTLDGKSGTLVVRYEGHNNGTFVRGEFSIGHGTNALTGAHGHGKFSGTTVAPAESTGPPPLNYTLHWRINPPEGPQTEDKDQDDHSHPDNDHGHNED
jgi:Protein of unknown function (DUF3224)